LAILGDRKPLSACAGFLFALAAILKTHELLVSQSLDSSTTVIASLGVIAFEFAMGFWLLSLWNSTSARYVAVCVFWGYCLVSISNIAKGVVDCGCFGVYRVPPAASLLICLTALISMCATLRTKSGKRLSSTGMMPAWILLFLASCSIVYGASIKASIHENSGPLKAAIGGALDLGETKKGSDLKFGIELRNASSEHPITITGIHPDCGCTQVIEVSTLDLAPAATGSVAFTWHVEGNPKTEARRRIQFVYLYDKELIATVVEVRVRITE
jgi:hypothetical protein